MPLSPQSIIHDRRSSQRKAAWACGQEDIWNALQTHTGTLGRFERSKLCQVFPYPLGSNDPKFLVKCIASDDKQLLQAEKRNQKFASSTLCGQGLQPASQEQNLIVCVPEVFRDFEYRDFYFLVMEFVPGRLLRRILSDRVDTQRRAGVRHQDDSSLYRYIAEGIRLLRVKAPSGASPGPVGGGIIRHPLFQDSQATISYRDVKMLETHLNKVSMLSIRTSVLAEKHQTEY